jgi:hypothetical protein
MAALVTNAVLDSLVIAAPILIVVQLYLIFVNENTVVFAKAVFPLAKFSAIMLVTVKRDGYYCTCLGYLGWRDK